MQKRNRYFLVFGIAIGMVVGIVISTRLRLSAVSDAQTAGAGAFSTDINSMETAIEKVAAEVGPAVVSIGTEQTEKIGGRGYYFGSPFEGDDSFNKFFEDFFGQMPEREFKKQGLGSGVIIDAEGYVLTNEHVVADADKITVTLPDGREFKGEVKGTDPRSDLAVIKINASNLPFAELGDSDEVRIGQWAVAIGNPYGYALHSPEPTVTVGVISALHRSLPRTGRRDRDYNDLVQTDAAINPGNSGGPLVNLKGEIIGINVAIFSVTGGYQGIGFAIPSATAKQIVGRLIEGKKVLYGWLGVTVQDLNKDLAEHFNLKENKGVLVANVLKGSPAEKGGIKAGDVVESIDGMQVDSVRELLKIVGREEVGAKVKIGVLRDGKASVLQVEIGERPDDVEEMLKTAPEEAGQWRGLAVQEVTPEIARRFRLEQDRGLVVVDVKPRSPADDSGIMPGDVIISINRQQIDTLSEYEKITARIKGNALVQTSRGYIILREE